MVSLVIRGLRGYGLFALLLFAWCLSLLAAWKASSVWAWSSGLLYIGYDTWLIGFVAWNTRHLQPPLRLPPMESSITLGVIVPARNEAAVIANTVDALLSQSAPADEILLVDDGSTDHTLAVLAERYGLQAQSDRVVISTRHSSLKLLAKANSGKADSLNQGWRRLQSEVILTLDADTRLDAQAVRALKSAFVSAPNLAIGCGVLVPRCRPAATRRFFEGFQRFEYLRAFLARAAWMRHDALLLVSGAFAAYRRSALEAIGGFDRNSWVEDYEITHRLHRFAHERGLDWRVQVIPQAQADTDAPNALLPFLRQRRRWFAGFLQTQHAYRGMIGNGRYGTVGRLMLPIKTADTLQPIFGLTAFGLLIGFAWSGRPVTATVLGFISGKLLVDYGYHLWAVHRYYRWLGAETAPRLWWRTTLTTLFEPFSFQLLRHTGATLGWLMLWQRRRSWMPQRN